MIEPQFNFGVKIPVSQKHLLKVIGVIAKKEKKIKGEVEINFIGDKKMTKLNGQYRGKNYPTDVLSFAWGEDNSFQSVFLGQIYICHQQIKRQAKEHKISYESELSRMLIHGLLHLVGHDHIKPGEAKKMFALQEGAVKELGYETEKFI